MEKKFLFTAILIFLWTSQVLAQDTFLWEISGNGNKNTSYLFGTFHLLNDEYLQRDAEILKKFDEAKIVVVESDVDSLSLMQATMNSIMMENEELPNLMNYEEHKMVLEITKSVIGDLPGYLINRFKPSILLMMISLKYATKSVPELAQYRGIPMDGFFTKKAKAEGKELIGLEDIEEQIKFFDHSPLQEQADQLVKFLNRSEEEIIREQRAAADTYLNPNFEKMDSLNKAYMAEYGDTYEIMIDKRNKTWMPTLEKYMKRNSTFIAVGAGHLPGENGLIALLRRRGYKVEAVR